MPFGKHSGLTLEQARERRRDICRNAQRRHRAKTRHTLTYRLTNLLYSIRVRCRNPRHISYRWYGAKGIRAFLTLPELFHLWHRDGAGFMVRPSVDRIDSNGDYAFHNCRFVELSENLKHSWVRKDERIANGHGKTNKWRIKKTLSPHNQISNRLPSLPAIENTLGGLTP